MIPVPHPRNAQLKLLAHHKHSSMWKSMGPRCNSASQKLFGYQLTNRPDALLEPVPAHMHHDQPTIIRSTSPNLSCRKPPTITPPRPKDLRICGHRRIRPTGTNLPCILKTFLRRDRSTMATILYRYRDVLW